MIVLTYLFLCNLHTIASVALLRDATRRTAEVGALVYVKQLYTKKIPNRMHTISVKPDLRFTRQRRFKSCGMHGEMRKT